MSLSDKYVHGDIVVLNQRTADSSMSEHAVLNSNTTYCSNRDTVGINSMHSFPAKLRDKADKLKTKIENINNHWMYSWILPIQDLESWYHHKQSANPESDQAKPDSDRGLSSIFTFKGGKSHMLKKVREQAHELQMKMVDLRPCLWYFCCCNKLIQILCAACVGSIG
jgi:hypothetical protein